MDRLRPYQQIMERMAWAATVRRCSRRTTVTLVKLECQDEPCLKLVNGPVRGHACAVVRAACGCAHAEQRAVVAMLENPDFVEKELDVELLSYLSPCSGCANLIVLARDSGVRVNRVIYVEEFEDQVGKRILRLAGVDVVKADRP